MICTFCFRVRLILIFTLTTENVCKDTIKKSYMQMFLLKNMFFNIKNYQIFIYARV